MPGFLDQVPLVELSPWALVAVFVLLVWRGRLVPRSFYDDKIHEANEWRAEGRLKDQTIAEQSEQINSLLEVGKTVQALLRALPVPKERE